MSEIGKDIIEGLRRFADELERNNVKPSNAVDAGAIEMMILASERSIPTHLRYNDVRATIQGAVDSMTRELREENERLRKTNRRLHRRVQKAESIAHTCVSEIRRWMKCRWQCYQKPVRDALSRVCQKLLIRIENETAGL